MKAWNIFGISMLRGKWFDLSWCNTSSGNQQIQNRIFPNVAHCLFMCHHRKIISIALQYFVMYSKSSFGSRTIRMHLGYIDSLSHNIYHKATYCVRKILYSHNQCILVGFSCSLDRCHHQFWSHTLKPLDLHYHSPPLCVMLSGSVTKKNITQSFRYDVQRMKILSYTQTLHCCTRLKINIEKLILFWMKGQ